MSSLGALGIGLSVVFVAFVLVLVAELYYLIFWKKRRNLAHRIQETALLQRHQQDDSDAEDGPDLIQARVNVIANRHQSSYLGTSTKMFQSSSSDKNGNGHHYLMGPPRFLFTIREETKEELESECPRSRAASLDFAAVIQRHPFSEPGTPCDTPFTTPPSSPSLFTTPPATPSPGRASSSSGIRALAREPPVPVTHCTILIPSAAQQQQQRRRTTMMMLLVNGVPGSPPGLSPAASPTAAAYSTPPTHLYSPRGMV